MEPSQILDTLVMSLVKETGSDIHIIANSPASIRIQGELNILNKLAVITKEDCDNILHIIAPANKIEEFKTVQQIDFTYVHREEYRFRAHAFMQQSTVAIVLRLIPKLKSLEELNLPQSLLDFAHKKQGFFLVVGPVGQGKSTTLAAMIEDINQKERKVISTIEDPVEYLYTPKNSFIVQREIGFDTPDFNTSLKGILRQDLDVILIGEMRDPDTIRTAVTAAETGRLVLSTLHTNSAAQTIDRIIDVFPHDQQDQIRAQLASSLLGIFSQRLLPRVSGGRIPAYELLICNSAIQNLIREKRTYEIDSVIETSSEQGMISLDRSLARLVNAGEVPVDEAMKVSRNTRVFSQMI